MIAETVHFVALADAHLLVPPAAQIQKIVKAFPLDLSVLSEFHPFCPQKLPLLLKIATASPQGPSRLSFIPT